MCQKVSTSFEVRVPETKHIPFIYLIIVILQIYFEVINNTVNC